jgi:hypothetical protein
VGGLVGRGINPPASLFYLTTIQPHYPLPYILLFYILLLTNKDNKVRGVGWRVEGGGLILSRKQNRTSTTNIIYNLSIKNG